jgi:hypothetical protein
MIVALDAFNAAFQRRAAFRASVCTRLLGFQHAINQKAAPAIRPQKVLRTGKEIIVVPSTMLPIKAPPIPPAPETIQSLSQDSFWKTKKTGMPATIITKYENGAAKRIPPSSHSAKVSSGAV